jgi:hypothetical protein
MYAARSDRTNVVQSALARNNLTSFLTHLGFGPLDAASQERLEVAFNDIWANNGDAWVTLALRQREP